MRQRWSFVVALFGVLLLATTSSSDVGSGSAASTADGSGSGSGSTTTSIPTGQPASSEPITGSAAVSATGWETKPKDPFAPYDVGSGGTWAYKDLSPAEQAYIDRGRAANNWDQVNAGFAQASIEAASQALADSASAQLGVEDAANTGVVE
jgi:hypothetical protein